MQINLQQEYTMTPDTPASMSGDPFDMAALLHTLAAASDWASFCEQLQHSVPLVLPATRLDIYAIGADRIGGLRFSSEQLPMAPPEALTAGVNLRAWFNRHAYTLVVVVPLVAVGQQCGWLVLARAEPILVTSLQAAAGQLAPLIAMRLQYELSHSDLLDRAAHVAELKQRIDASDALRLRALLATGTAHDIGNIFTMLMGHAQLLQQDLPAALQRDVSMIMRAAEDGRYLLRRLQSAAPRFITSAAGLTALASVIDEAVQFTRPLWDRTEKQIAIHTVVHDTPMTHAPAVDVREVLINLIMNAIAAMPNGGTITIGCDLIDGQAVVTVVDTGHGIPLDQQDEIFLPLMTTSEQGSGLGLSVSRVIIEGYGGTLTVSSAPGHGAAFTIRLPASQRDRAVSGH